MATSAFGLVPSQLIHISPARKSELSGMLSDPLFRASGSRCHELSEWSCREQGVRPQLTFQRRNCSSQIAVYRLKFSDSRLAPNSYKSIGQRAQQLPRPSSMYVRVGAVQVAQRLAETAPDRLEYVPVFASALHLNARDRQSELERHVETRCPWAPAVKLDSTKIMERISTFPYEAENAFQPSLPCRNFERGTRGETETAQAGYESEIQILVLRIVRNIQEHINGAAATAILSSRASSCRHQVFNQPLSADTTTCCQLTATISTPTLPTCSCLFSQSEHLLLEAITLPLQARLGRKGTDLNAHRVGRPYLVHQLNYSRRAALSHAQFFGHRVRGREWGRYERFARHA